MADDVTPKRPGPEPASDAKKHANKLVVLSSVAKPPMNEEDSLLGEPDPTKTPPLPPKTSEEGLIRPVGWTTRPGGTTTIIKLPPKTGVLPRLTSLGRKAAPPPLPAGADGEDETKELPPIKINPPPPAPAVAQEPVIAPAAAPKIEVKPQALQIKPPVVQPMPAAVKPPLVEARKPVTEIKPAVIEAKAPVVEVKPARKAVPPPLPPRVEASAPPPVVAASRPPASPIKPVEVKAAPPSEVHRVAHVPPLVAPDAPTPEAAAEAKISPKIDPNAQTTRIVPPSVLPKISPAQPPLSPPEAGKAVSTETVRLDRATKKHRLPPRATGPLRPADAASVPAAVPTSDKPVGRLTGPVATPPKVYPIAPATAGDPEPAVPAPRAPATITPQKATVTPPTIPLNPGKGTVRPPTIPLKPAPSYAPTSAFIRGTAPAAGGQEAEAVSPRAERKRKQRLIGLIAFYVLLVLLLPCLYFAGLYFTQETRVEGQIVPPSGMLLGNEAWIVTDFRDLAGGIASDLASDRQIVLQDMQEKVGHVQRAQADVATREGRIRLLRDQIQADNDEEMSLVKQARDAAQQIWDGPGAQMEADYQSRLDSLNRAIADRAKANHLNYAPDPNYYSPEVWANAFRLSLYQVPSGVDPVKERAWLDDQMKSWHAFTKTMDVKENDLRDQATKLKLSPAPKVADLKGQVDELQQRIDGTLAEEEPLKAELEQAQLDLKAVQQKEAALDGTPYQKLDALPEQNIIKRLDLRPNGRFSWRELEKESTYGAGEKEHVFWIFSRAFRGDGRQFWSLHRFTVDKNSTTELMIEPSSFVSTRAILRPDLSPDEQAQ
jgi:hypothetical protein